MPADLNRFNETYGQAANLATLGAAGGLFALLFFVGSALLLVELLIRSSLIYFLVAASPIVSPLACGRRRGMPRWLAMAPEATSATRSAALPQEPSS